MELTRSNWNRIYSFLFWWFGDVELPTSLCPLFWKTILGIIIFPIGSTIILIVMFFAFIAEYIRIPKIPQILPQSYKDKVFNFTEKVVDKLDFPYSKIIFLGIFILSSLSIFLFDKSYIQSLPSIFRTIWLISVLISMFIVLMAIIFFIAWGLLEVVSLIWKTKTVTKLSNNISTTFDFFMDKYCPLINWK